MAERSPALSRSARRFDELLAARGLAGRVVELPASTRTAAEAAEAVGCELRQIVKSLVFRARNSGTGVLILVAGSNRVDEGRMAPVVGEPLDRADPEFVRSVTGFAIGGVPPTGHTTPLRTFLDLDLLELKEVWAAAGHPHAVCRLSSLELVGLAPGTAVSVAPPGSPASGARWATFDCYGTLVDWRAGFAQATARLGVAVSREDPDRLFRAYLAAEPSVETGHYLPYREVMASAFARAAESVGSPISAATARELPESVPDWPIFPDVPEALEALRRSGVRVGILSNIDRDLLDATLRRQGIPSDAVVTAEEVRSYKPAPAHWARFLRQTSAEPRSVLHVSASYEYDLGTAAALGFPTAYVARYGALGHGRTVTTALPGLRELPTSPAVADLPAPR